MHCHSLCSFGEKHVRLTKKSPSDYKEHALSQQKPYSSMRIATDLSSCHPARSVTRIMKW